MHGSKGALPCELGLQEMGQALAAPAMWSRPAAFWR
jgi:hypothetical protein